MAVNLTSRAIIVSLGEGGTLISVVKNAEFHPHILLYSIGK